MPWMDTEIRKRKRNSAAPASIKAAIAAAIISALTSYSVAKRAASQKIAEFRVDWIEGFRKDVAALYKIQYEISSIKNKKLSARTADEKSRVRKLYYKSSELKARILLRLKQDSDNPAEAQLERQLKRAVRSDGDEAQEQRQSIRELARSILKTEWNRARTEIEK